jgi:ribosome biogenesis GTPase
VARELVPVPTGGVLLDTPGIRGLGLWDADEGVTRTFADIDELATRCRFSDCRHDGEPGCAVAAAITGGSLSARRYASYRKLREEMAAFDARRTQSARRPGGRPGGGRGRRGPGRSGPHR